jgi:hypothetical protein
MKSNGESQQVTSTDWQRCGTKDFRRRAVAANDRALPQGGVKPSVFTVGLHLAIEILANGGSLLEND